MFYTEWEILLVDDEPDVLALSKLAMQDFEVYGLPVKLHTAESKSQALAILAERPHQFFLNIAVAFVDVVMESDAAGLELIHTIREEYENVSMQLFVRTGQPGIAPERAVIDRYDINGYLTKAEATEDKLYSMVKSGVRQYMSVDWLERIKFLVNLMIQNANSRQQLEATLVGGLMHFDQLRAALSPESVARNDIFHAIQINDRILFTSQGLDEATAIQQINDLSLRDGKVLNEFGDLYIQGEGNHQCVKIAATEQTPEFFYYFLTTFQPPANILRDLHGGLREVSTLWQRAG